MGLRIGVDAGGTFTDLVARDPDTGETYSHKLPSTPQNPADAIVRGIEELIYRHDLDSKEIELIAHGTTVGTNTLLQRNGARVSLVTTRGFRDLLEIGRQTRPINYDMHTDFPAPVVPRHRRIEVDERISADGEIVKAVVSEEIERVLAAIVSGQPEAVAICFLFGYLNPIHEMKVKRSVESAMPGLFISASSEVQPEFREYERFSTTAINAYLQPVMGKYLDSLSERLGRTRPDVRIAISRSNGGLMSLPLARQFPIRTALSGPAAGVIGAIETLRSAGRRNAITFDMGGTSADIALVRDLGCDYRHRVNIGGFPIRMAMLDIHTVGAGGGSIAWFDKDDLLKVGPRSAGAHPGPACYGLGAQEPTVTDANLVLGRLPSGGLLDGNMELFPERARAAISGVAERLEISVEQGARGVVDIVTSNMVRAIRAVTVERGFDPRDFVLLAFGGAGPLHARQVAVELGMTEILVPPLPGILCAQGALASTFKEDLVRTIRRELRNADDAAAISNAISQLIDDAHRWVEIESLHPDALQYAVVLEMRYVGQNFELPIPLLPDEIGNLPPLETLRRRFFDHHDQQYGYHADDGMVEAVNIRLTFEILALPERATAEVRSNKDLALKHDFRMVWFGEKSTRAPIYSRASLMPGQKLVGPAVIDQADTTTLLFPGDSLVVDDHRNLIIGVQA